MAPRGAGKKNPFEDLDKEFQDAIAGSSVEDINKRIAELAKAEEENQKLKKEDEDLSEKKEQVKYAAEGYRDSTKSYKLKMRFIMQCLSDSGKV
jgi:hypothetical protein